MTTIPKSKGIQKLLFTLAKDTTDSAIAEQRCLLPPIGCGKTITEFNDPLSQKEYRISGLCQSCQNEVFKETEEES